MTAWATVLLCATFLASCNRQAAPTQPADQRGHTTGEAEAGQTSSTCAPGNPCEDRGGRCTIDDLYCTCAGPCRGADMPEAADGNVWACLRRAAGCPESVPANGSRCGENGLVCGYGTCGGASVTCRAGTWSLHEHDPPPSADPG